MAKMRMPTIAPATGWARGQDDMGPAKGGFEGRVLREAPQSPLGNRLARNVGAGGPGAGYDLIGKAGSNCQHGADAGPGMGPIGRTKDTLAEFGPES